MYCYVNILKLHRWLAARTFEDQLHPIALAGSQRNIMKLVLERP